MRTAPALVWLALVLAVFWLAERRQPFSAVHAPCLWSSGPAAGGNTAR